MIYLIDWNSDQSRQIRSVKLQLLQSILYDHDCFQIDVEQMNA